MRKIHTSQPLPALSFAIVDTIGFNNLHAIKWHCTGLKGEQKVEQVHPLPLGLALVVMPKPAQKDRRRRGTAAYGRRIEVGLAIERNLLGGLIEGSLDDAVDPVMTTSLDALRKPHARGQRTWHRVTQIVISQPARRLWHELAFGLVVTRLLREPIGASVCMMLPPHAG